jgi:hypothetical protein
MPTEIYYITNMSCNICDKKSGFYCGGCLETAYCSQKCAIKDWEMFHTFECIGKYNDMGGEKMKLHKLIRQAGGKVWLHGTRTTVLVYIKRMLFPAGLYAMGDLIKQHIYPISGETQGEIDFGPNVEHLSGVVLDYSDTNRNENFKQIDDNVTYSSYGVNLDLNEMEANLTKQIDLLKTTGKFSQKGKDGTFYRLFTYISRVRYTDNDTYLQKYRNDIIENVVPLMEKALINKMSGLKYIESVVDGENSWFSYLDFYGGRVNKTKWALEEIIPGYRWRNDDVFQKFYRNAIRFRFIDSAEKSQTYIYNYIHGAQIQYKTKKEWEESEHRKQIIEHLNEKRDWINIAYEAISKVIVADQPVIKFKEQDKQDLLDSHPLIVGSSTYEKVGGVVPGTVRNEIVINSPLSMDFVDFVITTKKGVSQVERLLKDLNKSQIKVMGTDRLFH